MNTTLVEQIQEINSYMNELNLILDAASKRDKPLIEFRGKQQIEFIQIDFDAYKIEKEGDVISAEGYSVKCWNNVAPVPYIRIINFPNLRVDTKLREVRFWLEGEEFYFDIFASDSRVSFTGVNIFSDPIPNVDEAICMLESAKFMLTPLEHESIEQIEINESIPFRDIVQQKLHSCLSKPIQSF
jgi:hypothetical protein